MAEQAHASPRRAWPLSLPRFTGVAIDVQARYGRRAGWLRHHVARALWHLGAYAPVRPVDWQKVQRLVFVCSGNICRSAYAEAGARKAGLRSISCGLAARDGDPANPAVVRRAALRDVDLSAHRARRFAPGILEPGDLLLPLEPAHLRALAGLTVPASITLLGVWAMPPRPHIEDPYGLCDAYVDTCLDVIDSAIARLSALARGAHAS
jgi:protein-tyrosine phosphatase